ncbi:MAG TPA: LysR family transcriptional regulator [Streptosporangiaceae bacterium]
MRPGRTIGISPIANSNITLRQLRAFLAVAEELSFSRAAERLVVSTPWLSETVKDLERQLKVTLFARTTRSVQLTEAGRVFSGLVAQVLDDLDDAIRVAQRMRTRPGRALTLGYVIGAGLELLPRLVRTYLDRHPEQRLNSVEYDFTDPTAGLRDHNVDAAIVRPPIGLAGIATLELTTEPRVACLPEGHRLARRDTVTVADLLPEPIIAAPDSPGPWRDYWLLTDYRTGPAPVVAEARTRDAELHMVARGEGISITSAGAGRYYARPGVVFLQISDIPYCSVALAWWPETSAAVTDLVETARELATPDPPSPEKARKTD